MRLSNHVCNHDIDYEEYMEEQKSYDSEDVCSDEDCSCCNEDSDDEGHCFADMMPPGTYYIGDLCYVMTSEEWDQFCAIVIKDGNCLQGKFFLPDGRCFATFTTKYGDSVYSDQFDREYCVDSGSIGCILVSDIRKTDAEIELGSISKMNSTFRVNNDDGIICIGSISIDTN